MRPGECFATSLTPQQRSLTGATPADARGVRRAASASLVITGRISTEPRVTLGRFSAHATAASRWAASIRKLPPSCSLVSAYGPSSTCRDPPRTRTGWPSAAAEDLRRPPRVRTGRAPHRRRCKRPSRSRAWRRRRDRRIPRELHGREWPILSVLLHRSDTLRRHNADHRAYSTAEPPRAAFSFRNRITAPSCSRAMASA